MTDSSEDASRATSDERDERDERANRRRKLEAWRAGQGAYPNDFRRTHTAAALADGYVSATKEALADDPVSVAVAGRVMLRRVMGKASFITLQDVSGRIQCYLRRDALGEGYAQFKDLWDVGDIVGVRGTLMRTNKGELTVEATGVELLNKTLLPLPEKFHGLADTETRYRRRYLDLIVNAESRELFRMRSRVVQTIREFFLAREFLEVETPMMQPIPGGATARPFVTHHNSLDMDLYLRIAPELYLKRLVVGGFERVFEINRSFRNEGLSTRHNPEFTMLEFYQAFADYEDLMDLTEDLMVTLCDAVAGTRQIVYQGNTIDFSSAARRISMVDAVAQELDVAASELMSIDRVKALLTAMNREIDPAWGWGKMLTELFEERVEPTLIQPTFITRYPAEVSPLARRNDAEPAVTDRFEFFAGGREMANGFSELNDPDDQAARFRDQVARKDAGDAEAMHFDQDYVDALGYGLPPTAGEGIGVDRLVMMLTDSASIRDVLLFPHMRHRAAAGTVDDDDAG